MPQRSFFNVLSDDLAASRDFYVDLFGYQVTFDSDWFVHLGDPDAEALEVGILRRDHEIVPPSVRDRPTGGLLTIVVDDVDAVHQEVLARGIEIFEEPRDLFYGQRRMLITDPNGLMIDVSSECDPDPDWLATLSA